MFRVLLCVLGAALTTGSGSAQSGVEVGATFAARDTLDPGCDASADANACLEGLIWQPAEFQVRCQLPEKLCGDWRIQFPSPLPSGDASNDEITVEWYMAQDEADRPIAAPAVVVVHESGSQMTVGRMIARGLQAAGLHAFMIQLPYYADRRGNGKRPQADKLIPAIRQAVADVRRARDAVAALPFVMTENISLQGTSLGGFVAATSASLDGGYHHVFIMLAGGDLYGVIQNGQRDTARVREDLAKAGFTGDALKQLLTSIEPTRIAHRMTPENTWIYSAKFDRVVPPENTRLLVAAARLDRSHHLEFVANHYSGVIYMPFILDHMRQQIMRGDFSDNDLSDVKHEE